LSLSNCTDVCKHVNLISSASKYQTTKHVNRLSSTV